MDKFKAALEKVGGVAIDCASPDEVVAVLAARTHGALLVSPCSSLQRLALSNRLSATGVEVVTTGFRQQAPLAAAGLTGANFAIAATGTVVLESTTEAPRLASTLPPVHFVLLDPRKVVPDSAAALPILRRLHDALPQTYLAYISGPSRTADIERVLTIGVHGPKELYVLVCEGVSDDFLES